MKTLRLFILSAFAIAFSASTVQAKGKFDVGRSLQEVMGTINEYMKIAQEKLDEVMAIQNRDLLGDAAEAAMSIDKVRTSVSQASSEINKVRNEAAGIYGDYNSLWGDVSSAVDEGGNAWDNVKNMSAKDAEAYAQNTYKALELQNQRVKAQADFKRRYAAEEARYNGDMASYDNNIQVLQEELSNAASAEQKKSIQADIDDLENQKVLRTEAYQLAVAQIDAEFDEMAGPMNEQINAVNELLVANLTKDQNENAVGIFDQQGSSTAEVLGSLAKDLYVPKDQPENTKTITKVQKARNNKAINDNLNLIAYSMREVIPIDDNMQYLEDMKSSVEIVDGSNAANAITMELANRNIQAMLTSLKLELLSLRAEVSQEMSEVSDYQMVDFVEDNFSRLNLCDYKYKSPDKTKNIKKKNNSDDDSDIIGAW